MIHISLQKKLAMADGNHLFSVQTSIEKGELVAVFGESGAGKTSLLRMIAGLMLPESGRIISEDDVWLDTQNKINLPVQKRNTGFVFQDLALFPNMSVLENLKYAAKGKSGTPDLSKLLRMVNLENLSHRKPATLSGGQQQRVALCRALAGKPELLLLDEPFSSLDMEMRRQLRDDLLRFHKEFHLTTLLVTHDLPDVYYLADKVIVLDRGEIVRSGTPAEVFGTGGIDNKIQIRGEILSIRERDMECIAEILCGSSIIRLPVAEEERKQLKPGMKVLVSSGVFEPVIKVLGC